MDKKVSILESSETITSVSELEELYGEPLKRSLAKEINYISEHYQAFIEIP